MSPDDNRRKFWQRMLAYFVSPSILMAQPKQTVFEEKKCVRIYHLFGNTPRQKAVSKAWLMWNDESPMRVPEDQRDYFAPVAMSFGNYVLDHIEEIKETEARVAATTAKDP
jgi:hypothetical protein